MPFRSRLRVLGVALTAGLAVSTAPAQASFLQDLGSPFTVGSGTNGVYAADFNHDGLPDLVTINGGAASASTLLRRPSGGFKLEGNTAIPDAPNFGVVADFNRDGWQDFASVGYTGAAATVQLRVPDGGFIAASGTPVGVGPSASITAADFNGDGFIDLAVAQHDAGTVQVLRQRRDGSFSAEGAPVPVGTQPRSIVVADFNADGRPDVAVTNIGSDNLSILLCQPDGSLVQEPGSPIRVGDQPWLLTAADLDADGYPDLVVPNYVSNTVDLLHRNAEGGFSPMPGSPLQVPGGPVGSTTADFNRDGLVDLAIGSHNTSAVNVLLRQPDGSYVHDASSPVPVGTNPYSVVAEDFNRDGKADLATANGGAGTVTALLNTTPDPVPPPAPPVVQPPATPPTPSINARLQLAWSVSKTSVKLTSARLRDVPVGSRVRIYCKPCKVSQTLTAKKSTVTLSKLRNKRLKRRQTFTVLVTNPGANGITLTRKVKNYGRTKKALRTAVKAPFIEGRRCMPLVGPRC